MKKLSVGARVEILDRNGSLINPGTFGTIKRVVECGETYYYDVTCDQDAGVWSFNKQNVKSLEENYVEKYRKWLTLPTDSEARKQIPMFSGCIKYFPAAIAGVAKISKAGNDKHNPGQELHHDRSKSLDHADCIIRHLADVADLIASLERGENTNPEQILAEVSSLAWRALAYSQTLHEKYDGAPLAPGAK